MRAPKREGGGGNTSGVFGQVFVRKRNVISHVILLFSRDCHIIDTIQYLWSYYRHNIVSRIRRERTMASANNVFSCCDIFLRPSERRNVFSSSGEFVLPPLKQVVADVSGKADKLPDVFLLGSKLCGPWHRRLEAIDPLNAAPFRRKSKALDSKQ